MGLLDFLSGGHEAQLKRQTKKASNINAQPEDREAAARWLYEDGSEGAIYGLLGRFDVTIENQMKDAAEKEFVFDLLLALGAPVLEPTRVYVERCKSIAYPLRLIETVGGRSELVTVLLHLLDREATREDFKSEPKKQLLIRAAECRDPRFLASAARFLTDFDEGVRYAASEVIIAQESEEGRLPLLQALANAEEESNRLRQRIADIFFLRKWSLEPRVEDLAAHPPLGWKVNGVHLARSA
jgi:hypothetical protein